MSTSYCHSCGAALDNDSQFCKSCGAPVSAPVTVNQQPINQQPINQQPYSGYVNSSQSSPQAAGTEPLEVVDYIGMILLGAIPVAGFVILLIWAFGSESNLNRKNYARAVLILMIVGIILSIVFSAALFGIIRTISN